MPRTGDVWSTAGDLARFVAAVHSGELLPSAVQRLLHRSPVPVGRRGDADALVRTASYGLGHFVGTVDGEPAYLHPGDNPGYLALAAWLPRSATAVVVLTNDEAVDIKRERSTRCAGHVTRDVLDLSLGYGRGDDNQGGRVTTQVVLAYASGHRGPAYFFAMGISLIVIFAPFVVAPDAMRRLNSWLAKSRTIRAMARARSGTDQADPSVSDTRIRVVCAVATLVGVAFLVIGIVRVAG